MGHRPSCVTVVLRYTIYDIRFHRGLFTPIACAVELFQNVRPRLRRSLRVRKTCVGAAAISACAASDQGRAAHQGLGVQSSRAAIASLQSGVVLQSRIVLQSA
eukprot:5841676-Prymnesium_polylepis.2